MWSRRQCKLWGLATWLSSWHGRASGGPWISRRICIPWRRALALGRLVSRFSRTPKTSGCQGLWWPQMPSSSDTVLQFLPLHSWKQFAWQFFALLSDVATGVCSEILTVKTSLRLKQAFHWDWMQIALMGFISLTWYMAGSLTAFPNFE